MVCVMYPSANARLGRLARCYILLVLAVVLAPGVVSQIKFTTKKKKADASPRSCAESDVCRRQAPLSYQGNPGEPRIIVVFPDNHRSGGPAHFHQVHSGLNRLGFLSLMHHVNPYYADEHMKNMSTMLTPDEISSRDILILPCNWEGYLPLEDEMKLRAKGTRAVVLVTGVSYPEETDLLDLSDFTKGRAIPFAHSHYSHTLYQLPWNASRHIVWAPVEPWVVKAHHEYERVKQRLPSTSELTFKENRILVDPDAKMDALILPNGALMQPPTQVQSTTLFGKTRDELIQLFKRSKVMYDVYLNGHEHLPREAVLFDVIPVLTRADNGGDMVDFPLPPEFRVDELCNECATRTLGDTLLDFDDNRPKLDALKRAVLERPTELLRTLDHTFATRSYQFQIDTASYAEEGHALIAAIRLLSLLPLASVQITVRPGGTHRLVRRAGGLSRKLQELGLTDKAGGKLWHSLRIVEQTETTVFHGDLIVAMKKPFYVYDMAPLLELGKQLLREGGCDRFYAAGQLEIKLLFSFPNTAASVYKCEDRPQITERAYPGFVSMDVFSLPSIFVHDFLSAELSAVPQDTPGQILHSICADLCALSQSSIWQATGIFQRVFNPQLRTDNTSIILRVGKDNIQRSFSCTVDAEDIVDDMAHELIHHQGVVGVPPEELKRILLPAVEGRLTSSRCSSDAYNSVCQDVCVF